MNPDRLTVALVCRPERVPQGALQRQPSCMQMPSPLGSSFSSSETDGR